MATRTAEKDGFIAALDQSGSSMPKSLKLYGVDDGNPLPGVDALGHHEN